MKSGKSPVIWCIRPWIEDFSAFDHFNQPAGFLAIAGWLLKQGCDVHYIDLLRPESFSHNHQESGKPVSTETLKLKKYQNIIIEKPDVFRTIPRYYRRFGIESERLIKRFSGLQKPDTILITTGMTYWYPSVVRLLEILDMMYPDTPKAVGGIWAGIVPEHVRDCLPGVTVFSGQAEKDIFNWISHILTTCISTPDCNNHLTPAWNLVNPLEYAVLSTSRGCFHRCLYCVASRLASTWHAYPLNAIANEIEMLVSYYGIRHVALYDDDLGCVRPDGDNQFLKFLKMLKCLDAPIRWYLPNAIGVASVTDETALLMRESGFEQPRLSLHHLDRHLNKNGLSDNALKMYHKSSKALVNAGYRSTQISTYLVAGLPGQKLEWFETAVDQLLNIGIRPYLAQFSPIPGTHLGDIRLQVLREQFKSDDMLLTNKILSVYAHDGWSGDEYQKFVSDLKLR